MKKPHDPSHFLGGCLCGNIRYRASGQALFPHFCSCDHCQRWSGAPALAWVDFHRVDFEFTGPGGEPTLYRSRKKSQRGFCPACGSSICAIDDGSKKISVTIGSLDTPDLCVPQSQSYADLAPHWLSISATPETGDAAKK